MKRLSPHAAIRWFTASVRRRRSASGEAARGNNPSSKMRAPGNCRRRYKRLARMPSATISAGRGSPPLVRSLVPISTIARAGGGPARLPCWRRHSRCSVRSPLTPALSTSRGAMWARQISGASVSNRSVSESPEKQHPMGLGLDRRLMSRTVHRRRCRARHRRRWRSRGERAARHSPAPAPRSLPPTGSRAKPRRACKTWLKLPEKPAGDCVAALAMTT